MADAINIFEQLIRGLSLVGNAITSAVKYVLNIFGVNVPDSAITLATIIFAILLIYKFENAVNKIVLFALIFLLISSLAGLVTPFLSPAISLLVTV